MFGFGARIGGAFGFSGTGGDNGLEEGEIDDLGLRADREGFGMMMDGPAEGGLD
jgi:hypothetical protein